MSELQATIPKGSVVLVTGATGFVASHITRQLLERGYKVRGTVRDVSKATWLTEESFSPLATPENLELVAVPDLAVPHAFDEAVKGVSAIAHVATIVNLEPDPKDIVPQTVGGVVGILEAAASEPSVKEFVHTSSVVAGTFPTVGNDTFVKRDTWNDAATKLAYAPPPYGPAQWFFSYAESKVAAEKAVWKFAEERKPHFNVNVVSPSGIFGEPLNEKHAGSAGDWISILFKGDMERLGQFSGGHFIDVEDVAAVHVAAILDPETENARLQAWGYGLNWNHFLAELRKLRPQHEFISDFEDTRLPTIDTDQTEPEALLRKWTGHSWNPLAEVLSKNVNSSSFPY